MSEENKIRDAADAIKGIAEAVPIYSDLLQPAVKEVGAGLHTISKTIHIALAPVSALVWGYEQIEKYLSKALEERLKNLPSERVTTPALLVAGPTLEAMRFAGEEPALRELYANLLATAMDSKTAIDAHPAFVEIIRQLTPDEARIINWLGSQRKRSVPVISVRANLKDQNGSGFWVLRHFLLLGKEAGCVHPERVSIYVDNLCRLQLIQIPENYVLSDESHYEALEKHPVTLQVIAEIEQAKDRIPKIQRETLLVTILGLQFYNSCVATYEHS